MTTDQIMGVLRQILPILGGLATGLGWLTVDQVTGYTQIILQIAGPAVSLVGIIWSLKANSKTSILTAVSNMPELAAPVKLTDAALAASVPNGMVVAAPPGPQPTPTAT